MSVREPRIRPRTGWARRRARFPGSARVVIGVTPPAIALTFDDGPHPTGTPAVLDALAASRARGTFFVLTDRAESDPILAREIVAAGHEVALHGDRHERLDRIGTEALADRLRRARARLEQIAQAPVAYFRPPFGRASLRTFRAARRAGMQLALWSHDPRDWEPGAEQRIERCLVEGAVVLLHDGSELVAGQAMRTAEALERCLPAAIARGLVPGTLTGLGPGHGEG